MDMEERSKRRQGDRRSEAKRRLTTLPTVTCVAIPRGVKWSSSSPSIRSSSPSSSSSPWSSVVHARTGQPWMYGRYDDCAGDGGNAACTGSQLRPNSGRGRRDASLSRCFPGVPLPTSHLVFLIPILIPDFWASIVLPCHAMPLPRASERAGGGGIQENVHHRRGVQVHVVYHCRCRTRMRGPGGGHGRVR